MCIGCSNICGARWCECLKEQNRLKEQNQAAVFTIIGERQCRPAREGRRQRGSPLNVSRQRGYVFHTVQGMRFPGKNVNLSLISNSERNISRFPVLRGHSIVTEFHYHKVIEMREKDSAPLHCYPDCKLVVRHDDYSLLSKLPRERTSVVTILRNPVDLYGAHMQFSVQVAARLLG
ncbi:hypothetical protein EJB05_27143, partial [Eragrostis curvula]